MTDPRPETAPTGTLFRNVRLLDPEAGDGLSISGHLHIAAPQKPAICSVF